MMDDKIRDLLYRSFDGELTSDDLALSFVDGGYTRSLPVPELAPSILLLIAITYVFHRKRTAMCE